MSVPLTWPISVSYTHLIENAAGKAGGLLDKVADMTAEERAALKEKLQELDQQDDATKNEE